MHAVRWLRRGIFVVVFLSLCSVGHAAYKNKMKPAETPVPAAAPVAAPIVATAPAPEAATAPAAVAMPTPEEMMAKMQEYSTPNENHKALDVFVGSWDYTMKMWMDPTKEPEVATGTTEIKSILDGRFIEQTATGTCHGQPFEGHGLVGYDNAKKAYVSTWYDNMSTGIMTGTGSYDAATKTFTEKGDFTCPINGPMAFRSEIVVTDENTHSYTMYMTGPDGKENKAMELVYTKKQAAAPAVETAPAQAQ